MLEKKFKNVDLGIEITSFIDKKLRVWFKAKEVAQILGYKDTNQAVRKHVSENHERNFLLTLPVESTGQQNYIKPKCSPVESTGQQNDTRAKYCIFLDEPGFYELVFKSRLPSAKIFREWVFSKVLPSLRKYGYYKIIDSKIKQRVLIDGKQYYKHPVFTNYAASKNGKVINAKTGRSIKMGNCGGYLHFTIYDKKLEKRINYYQHRFVFEVFKGPIPKCLEVDHINNDKTDNRIKNLQLLNPKQNIRKSKNKPIISTCIETGKEKRFKSFKKASIELGVCHGSISNICRKIRKTATSKKDGKKYTFRYLD